MTHSRHSSRVATSGGVIVALLSVSAAFTAASTRAEVSVTGLRCESRQGELVLDEPTPRLSWRIESEERGQRQTAYRILVASSPDALTENRGDLWDSGRVEIDTCVLVPYAGRPLASHQDCYWKVRAWDRDGKPSEWSAVAHWRMAIMDPALWRARWIGYDKPYDADTNAGTRELTFGDARWIWGGQTTGDQPAGKMHLRRAFDIGARQAVKTARVLITADDAFTLYVNGHPAGQNSGAYAWKHPREIDIAAQLVPGRNVIAVEAENAMPGPAGVIAAAKIDLERGRPVTLLSDDSWRISPTAPDNWTLAAFDDSAWATAQTLGTMGVQPWGIVQANDAGWRQTAPSPLLRRAFTVAKPVRRALAYVCGLGYHEARINGRKVGDHVLEPPFTRYDRHCMYEAYDVTPLLKSGDNAVGVMLGNGWYNVHTRAAWDFDQAPWRGRPRLLFQLHLFYADGTDDTIVSDDAWRAATGPLVYDGIRHGEVYDARREHPGWDRPGFDDANWAPPRIVDAPAGPLRLAVGPPIRVIETLAPKQVRAVADGVYVLDFGQNIAGWAHMTVEGAAGTRVRLRYGERVREDGSLKQDEIAAHIRQGPVQTDVYVLKGGGPESYETRFAYHGFQYLEVTGYPGTPTADNFRACVVHTDFQPTGAFECSNPLLNDIQRLTLWAYRGNFVGYPTDCPHREKNGWTGDAHLAAEQAMFNWWNDAAYAKWLDDLKDEQRPTGELPGIVPTGGWGYKWGNGPAWDSAYLLIPWYMYEYRGDTRILERHFEGWKRYVDYLTGKRKDNGTVAIGLGDWAPAKTRCPTDVTSTGYYYVDARIVADAARILGRTDDAARYAAVADTARTAFNTAFARGDGRYADGSQTAQSCAIYQELVPDADRDACATRLREAVQAADEHIDTGILGAKYLFHALSNTGGHADAYRIATQTNFPSYGDWVTQGATTLWEQWNGDASRNHIMFGDISCWFYRSLAGINPDPDAPGFKHIIMRPRPVGNLTSVTAWHECPYGRIESAWKIAGTRFAWTVVIPPNTTATLYVPTATPGELTIDGQPAQGRDGVKVLPPAANAAVVELESGRYRLDAPAPAGSP